MASIELNSNLFSFQTNEREREREGLPDSHQRIASTNTCCVGTKPNKLDEMQGKVWREGELCCLQTIEVINKLYLKAPI